MKDKKFSDRKKTTDYSGNRDLCASLHRDYHTMVIKTLKLLGLPSVRYSEDYRGFGSGHQVLGIIDVNPCHLY